jgi:hypothetical protein
MSDNATISLTEKEFSLFRELIYKEAGIALAAASSNWWNRDFQSVCDLQSDVIHSVLQIPE